MTLHLPTASAVGRAMRCLGSALLPRTDFVTDDNTWGHVADAFIQRARAVGRARALGEIEDPEHRARCEAIDVDAIPAGAELQVAVAYDAMTGVAERLALRAHRAYVEDGRLYGTFDVVGMLSESTLYYDDTKTGNPEPAEESWQLKAGAVYLAALTGATEAVVGHLRLGFNGRWYADRVTFDAFDLERFADELRQLVQRLRAAHAALVERGELPDLSAGPWCRYCAALPHCPAQMSMVRAMVTDLASVEDRLAALTPEQQGEAYVRLVYVERVAERVRETLRELAKREPIPLPNGQVLREVQTSAWTDDDVAKQRKAQLKAQLVEERHTTLQPTTQVRPVGRRKKG